MRVFRAPGPALLLAASAASCLVLSSLAAARETPVAPGIQRERVNLVLLDVVVTDRMGRPIHDLRPEEFLLRVEGHPRPIHSVELRRAGEAVIGVGGFVRKGGEGIKRFAPAVHVFEAGQPAKAIPLKIPVSREGLEPGVHTLVIEVKDRVGKRGITQSLDFMVR